MGKNKKNKKDKKLTVNPELEGLDVEIDELGQIRSTLDIDKINNFLDHSVDDKKLKKHKNGNDN
jgi:hypothetical protein